MILYSYYDYPLHQLVYGYYRCLCVHNRCTALCTFDDKRNSLIMNTNQKPTKLMDKHCGLYCNHTVQKNIQNSFRISLNQNGSYFSINRKTVIELISYLSYHCTWLKYIDGTKLI